MTGNEVPNRPSVAGTASEVERNNARACQQGRFAGLEARGPEDHERAPSDEFIQSEYALVLWE